MYINSLHDVDFTPQTTPHTTFVCTMPGSDNKSLKEIAEDKLKSGNASQLGDPVSLKAETADSEPTEQDRGARGAQPPRKDTNLSLIHI